MKWTKPEHKPGKVDEAGKIISRRKPPHEHCGQDAAVNIAANWRSAHGYPLQVIGMTLRNRAEKFDSSALVAQRLKRMPSVIKKLERFKTMQLSEMQDLGGCRAVVDSIDQLKRLVEVYRQKPCQTAKFYKKNDYIAEPKADGYRSFHIVYRYHSKDEQRALYNGLKIEIQIRSKLQHAWAVAVETIDTFTRQAIKSGLGTTDWLRFFVLASGAMAIQEGCPTVPGTPKAYEELLRELRRLRWTLRVEDRLLGLSAGLRITEDIDPSTAYILILDSKERVTTALGFKDDETASAKYSELEKEHLNNPSIQIVQVSVTSLFALKRAYPNYYLDTNEFLSFLDSVLGEDDTEDEGKDSKDADEEDALPSQQ